MVKKRSKPLLTTGDGTVIEGFAPSIGIDTIPKEIIRRLNLMIEKASDGNKSFEVITDESCLGDILDGEELARFGLLFGREVKGGETILALAAALGNRVH